MDFLPTLSTWEWLLLAAVPAAIVALYFLKLRRQPLEVPSTLLWHKTIEDLHVNALWQRIHSSLLLYLQLLAVALVVLALLRPGWRSGELAPGRAIFLIDSSASMNASDVHPSRLAEARRKAIALVDSMRAGDQGLVISFSDTARVEQNFTDNRQQLREAIERIRPTNRATVIDDALRVAAGLANPARAAAAEEKSVAGESVKLFILSDGKFPSVRGFSLDGLEPIFIPIGSPEAKNIGIVAFAVQPSDEERDHLQAFASIQNFGDREATVPVDLLLDGKPIDAANLKVPPGESSGVTFNLTGIESGVLELRLAIDDDFAPDNSAWVAVNGRRTPKVLLVTAGNEPLEQALSTPRATELAAVEKAPPSLLTTKEHEQAAANGRYDLIIYDRCRPTEMPRANTLFIGAVPPESPNRGWALGERIAYPQIIDVHRNHPLVEWVDLNDVDIVEAREVKPPSGGTRLIDSTKGILLAIASREGFEDAVLGFEIYGVDEQGHSYPNTNWPIRRSFPAFIYALLDYLGGHRTTLGGEFIKPGQIVSLKSDAAQKQLEVRAPDGSIHPVPGNSAGTFRFADTDAIGTYNVLEEGQATQSFTVNLFDPAESDIRPAKANTIQIGHVAVEGRREYEPVRREAWKWLLLVALVVLLVEWYIYNRRVYV
jgi:hypothetical protein